MKTPHLHSFLYVIAACTIFFCFFPFFIIFYCFSLYFLKLFLFLLTYTASGIPTRLRSTSAIDLSAVRRAKARASYSTVANLQRGSGASLRKLLKLLFIYLFDSKIWHEVYFFILLSIMNFILCFENYLHVTAFTIFFFTFINHIYICFQQSMFFYMLSWQNN